MIVPLTQRHVDDVLRAFKRFKEKGREEVIKRERAKKEKQQSEAEEKEKAR